MIEDLALVGWIIAAAAIFLWLDAVRRWDKADNEVQYLRHKLWRYREAQAEEMK